MSNIERNVYAENIHLRNKFYDIYRMVIDHGFVRSHDTPSSLGLQNPLLMEIFRIAKTEKEIERVIQEKSK